MVDEMCLVLGKIIVYVGGWDGALGAEGHRGVGVVRLVDEFWGLDCGDGVWLLRSVSWVVSVLLSGIILGLDCFMGGRNSNCS